MSLENEPEPQPDVVIEDGYPVIESAGFRSKHLESSRLMRLYHIWWIRQEFEKYLMTLDRTG